jgi:hypothetical protein
LALFAHPGAWSRNEPSIATFATSGAPVEPNSTPTPPPKQ